MGWLRSTGGVVLQREHLFFWVAITRSPNTMLLPAIVRAPYIGAMMLLALLIRLIRPHIVFGIFCQHHLVMSFGVSPRNEVNGLWISRDLNFSYRVFLFCRRFTDFLLVSRKVLTCRVHRDSNLKVLLEHAGFEIQCERMLITRMEKQRASNQSKHGC